MSYVLKIPRVGPLGYIQFYEAFLFDVIAKIALVGSVVPMYHEANFQLFFFFLYAFNDSYNKYLDNLI